MSKPIKLDWKLIEEEHRHWRWVIKESAYSDNESFEKIKELVNKEIVRCSTMKRKK